MSDIVERRRREMELFKAEVREELKDEVKAEVEAKVKAEVEAKSKDELDKANARAEAAEKELALLKAQLKTNRV